MNVYVHYLISVSKFYLVKFYEGFGFKTTSEKYIEDMLYHIEMTKDAKKQIKSG